MTKHRIVEVDGSNVTLELDRGFHLSEQRTTSEGTSITVKYAGRSIVVRQRSKGSLEAEGDHTFATTTKRTGARTLADAIEWAVKQLHQFVRSPGSDTGNLEAAPAHSIDGYPTLIHARNLAYERRVWAHCSLSQQNTYKRILDIALVVFGPDKPCGPWDQSDVDRLFAVRCGATRNGRLLTTPELTAYGIDAPGIRFPAVYGRRDLRRVKLITCKNELMDLKVVFGYLMALNVGSRRFLPQNPLDGLDFGSAIRDTRADYHRARFTWLMAAADHADPTGQLRLVLVLTFLAARRIDAVMKLEMAHLGFTKREVRALIRRVRRTHESEPVASETWAEPWKYGALYWILENDKERFDRVTPNSSKIERELRRYLSKRHARLGSTDSGWLFPRLSDPSEPMLADTLRDRLREAEEIARRAIEGAGLDPDEIMPATPGDAYHPARGWWEARHSELGWAGNRNASYVGGWTCNTGAVQSTVYGELDPRLMLACMEGLSYSEAAEELGLIDDAQTAMDPHEPVIVETAAAA